MQGGVRRTGHEHTCVREMKKKETGGEENRVRARAIELVQSDH